MQKENIEINEEFAAALSLLENSRANIFITGRAGTGKSTLLEYFRYSSQKRMAVLAPTGVSALNVSGQTIHSFFKLPPHITPETVLEQKLSKKRKRLISELDMLIIDEASMLRADLLDCIDASLRHHRQEESLPFGGVQMVFIGDLYQLPPVLRYEEKELFEFIYQTPYFFSAKSIARVDLHLIELEKIYRQKDQGFIQLLNRVRDKSATLNDINALNQRHQPKSESQEFVITLTTTNASADRINSQELAKLTNPLKTYEGDLQGEFTKRNVPTLQKLELKVGAQIMLLNNDPGGRWVNGSLGKIIKTEFDAFEGDDTLQVALDNGNTVTVTKHTWTIEKYFFNDEKGKIDTEVAGSFTQFPVRLAWGVTIHKSQGKTFEKVIIDLGRGAFAHGQLYVALSRCTSLEGITLKTRIRPQDIRTDQRVNQFFRNLRGHAGLNNSPSPSAVPTPDHEFSHWQQP